MNRRNDDGKFLLGALFGASVASIVALLFAPKSGAELRQDISDEFDEFLLKAEDYKDYAVDKGSEWLDQANEVKEDIELSIRKSVDKAEESFDEFKDEASKKMNKAKEEASEKFDEAKKDAEEVKDVVKEEAKDLGDDINLAGEYVYDSAKDSYKHVKDTTEKAAKDKK